MTFCWGCVSYVRQLEALMQHVLQKYATSLHDLRWKEFFSMHRPCILIPGSHTKKIVYTPVRAEVIILAISLKINQ